jgi:hypothetical protein
MEALAIPSWKADENDHDGPNDDFFNACCLDCHAKELVPWRRCFAFRDAHTAATTDDARTEVDPRATHVLPAGDFLTRNRKYTSIQKVRND